MFEVKAILASRLRRTQGLLVKELEVQWADSPEGKSYKDSWEPIEGLSQCSTILSDFLQKEADEKKKKKEDKSKNNRTQISYYKDYEHKQTHSLLIWGNEGSQNKLRTYSVSALDTVASVKAHSAFL